MSRDSPTLDELYGPGAEDADNFASYLDSLRERWEVYCSRGDPAGGIAPVYEAELTRLWNENRKLEGQLVSAGEEIERLELLKARK